MVQATLDIQWVPAEILPATFNIEKVEEKTALLKGGKQYIYFVLLVSTKGQLYTYDAKFGDKNFLINNISAETNQWIGKKIGIRMGAKYKELCSPTS